MRNVLAYYERLHVKSNGEFFTGRRPSLFAEIVGDPLELDDSDSEPDVLSRSTVLSPCRSRRRPRCRRRWCRRDRSAAVVEREPSADERLWSSSSLSRHSDPASDGDGERDVAECGARGDCNWAAAVTDRSMGESWTGGMSRSMATRFGGDGIASSSTLDDRDDGLYRDP